jgi:putative ABC transport system permease protein
LLRERRQVSEGEDDNFNIFDTQRLTETLSSTMRVLISLLGAVTAVSLLMGGIGVVFGYFPAQRVTRMDPIEAWGHE